MEVDEEADGQAEELEVGDDLRLMDREQSFDSFDFDDHAVLHHDVEAVAAVEGEAFVVKGDGELTLEAEFTQRELMRQAVLVRGLEKPRPEVAVDFDASTDDELRNPIPPPFLRSSVFHFPVVGAPGCEVASLPDPMPSPSPFLRSSLFNLRAFLPPSFLPSSLPPCFSPSDLTG